MKHRIPSLLFSFLAMMMSFTSCGLIDMEFDEGESIMSSLSLPYDSVYVMVGDTFDLTPIITPAEHVSENMLWTSRADSVLRATDNMFIAVGEGESVITCMNVETLISDTCHVTVLPRWQLNAQEYFENMVFIADVTLDGKPFDPETQTIVARINNTILGIGQRREAFGIKYIELRVWFPSFVEPDLRDEFNNILVHFSLYDRRTLQLYDSKEYISLDRESHGTLSELYEIRF